MGAPDPGAHPRRTSTIPAQLDKLLAIGAEKARSVASVTLRTVYERIGFLAPAPSGSGRSNQAAAEDHRRQWCDDRCRDEHPRRHGRTSSTTARASAPAIRWPSTSRRT